MAQRMAPIIEIGDDSVKIDKWLTIGPFLLSKDLPPDISKLTSDEIRRYFQELLDKSFLSSGNEGEVRPLPQMNDPTGKRKWKERVEEEIDFNRIYRNQNPFSVAYAYCVLQNDFGEERTVELTLHSDNRVVLWINGQRVPNEDRFTVSLSSGENHCLVKVAKGMGDWKCQLTVSASKTATETTTEPARGEVRGFVYRDEDGKGTRVGNEKFLRDVQVDLVDLGGSGERGGSFSGSVQELVADIASYMPTTHESEGPATRRGGGGSGGGNLKQLVDSALTAVLGRRLKADDPKLFRASLKQAFTVEQQNGRSVYVWTPRSYAVQTELGGELTGAQASLYHRAKIALDDALPLLRGLEPLIPSPDREATEAVRGIIRTELSELVEELGAEGGPRVQRVDSFFRTLERHFGRMREAFGFEDGHVNSVDEERRLTDFFVIRDYVRDLRAAWEGEGGFREQFTGNRRYLGTQLVLLSRALSVVAESVDECYQAMDAVALGPAERQTVRIDFPTHIHVQMKGVPVLVPVLEDESEQGHQPPPLLIEELMSWVLRFATDEGRLLIEEGGRQGVMAMQPTARQLQLLVQGAAEAKVSHVGFSRTRVRRALNELAVQLGQVDRLARELNLEAGNQQQPSRDARGQR